MAAGIPDVNSTRPGVFTIAFRSKDSRRDPVQKIASPASKPSTRNAAKIASAAKNSHFAIVAAPAETPENPKKPATTDTIKKINAHFNTRMSLAFGSSTNSRVYGSRQSSFELLWDGYASARS